MRCILSIQRVQMWKRRCYICLQRVCLKVDAVLCSRHWLARRAQSYDHKYSDIKTAARCTIEGQMACEVFCTVSVTPGIGSPSMVLAPVLASAGLRVPSTTAYHSAAIDASYAACYLQVVQAIRIDQATQSAPMRAVCNQ